MAKINHIAVDFQNPAPEVVQIAADNLSGDNLIVAPTETRYGLLARADSSVALEKLYVAKKREQSMPTAIFVDSVASIATYAEVTAVAQRIAEEFMPGPVTLVLEARANLPNPVVMQGKIGIRVSTAPFIRLLLDKIDFPITATSANISGVGSSALIPVIICSFENSVNYYFDSGKCDRPASTVVDCTGLTPRILRAEAISERQINACMRRQVS